VSAASCVWRSRTPSNSVKSLPAGGYPPPPNRRWMPDVLTPKAPRACGRFPTGLRTGPPCVFVCQRFSAPAHSTCGGQIECGGLPAISTFQRHSTQHPSIVGPLPVFSCSCSRPFRLCSTYWVNRTAHGRVSQWPCYLKKYTEHIHPRNA
jgi:hypothetical protein